MLAKHALSQLSYGPNLKATQPKGIPSACPGAHPGAKPRKHQASSNVVGLDRLELSTSPLSGVRSNHLSYRPARQADNPPIPHNRAAMSGPPGTHSLVEERETETAKSRHSLIDQA